MKCPHCQAENPDDALYCSLCFTRFVAPERSQKEEEAKRIRERHQGWKLRCPNCEELSPVDSPFCMRCGFVFEELEPLLVPEEEWCRQEREKEETVKRELEFIHAEPIVVTGEGEGAEIIRRLEGIISEGDSAHVRARGRIGITYAMKIIALLGEDLRKKGRDVVLRVQLLSDEAVKELEDLELGIILKGEQEGH